MAKIDTKNPGENNGLSPYGTIDFFQRTESSLSRPVFHSKPILNPKEEAEVTATKAKAAKTLNGQFTNNADGKENDESSARLFMLMSLWSAQNADASGQVDGNSFVNIIETLKNQFGVDTSPVEKLVERVTGKPYSEFKNSAGDTSFNVSGFYHQDDNGNRTPIIRNKGFDSDRVLRIAAGDNAGAGNCAKGVANIAQSLGWDVQRGHATEWDKTLPRNGWVKLNGVNPNNAPEGSVLVYNSDIELGKRARNSGGGVYGHVEFVAEGNNGQKLFVSDKARNNAGGSVPNNFAGAYIYVGDNAPASNFAIRDTYNSHGTLMASNRHPAPSPIIA